MTRVHETVDTVFPRRFGAEYPVAVRAEGVYIWDEEGRRYLDAAGGAAVMTIGHGVPEVLDAMSRAAREVAYVHSAQFRTRAGIELADLLGRRFPGPPQMVRVHFTSGGSEATETAIKIARQYWLSKGEPGRWRMVSRWQGYHGTTLGALAVSGNRRRRAPYEPLLPPADHVAPCFCYRCQLGLQYPSCSLACAEELDTLVRADPGSVAAFIFEPVVGASTGAVPVDGYLPRIREICTQHGVLLIADEVMAGAGRTGRYFACEHWNVTPDIILLGKGLSSGYAPLGAVLVAEHVWRAIEGGTATLEHGFTYQDHPVSLAAGLAVQHYLDRRGLLDQVTPRGGTLAAALERLRELPCVGDVRGKGLLQTVELVADPATRTPFPAEARVVERAAGLLRKRGAIVYPMRGTADGLAGEHIMLAPPFVVTDGEIEWLVEQIADVLRTMS